MIDITQVLMDAYAGEFDLDYALAHFAAVEHKLRKSSVLRRMAVQVSEDQFSTCDELDSEILNSIISLIDKHPEICIKAMNSWALRAQLKQILLHHRGLREVLLLQSQ